MKKYVALAETITDCQQIKKWEHQNTLSVQIIALSLEALNQTQNAIHVWTLLPMEKIFQDSYDECQRLGKCWEDQFSGTNEMLYDNASRYQLSEECWYHALVAEKTAEALSELFEQKGWIYLENRTNLQFIGSRSAHFQKQGNHNAVFKEIAAKIFRGKNIPVVSISKSCSVFNFFKSTIALPIILKCIFNIAEFIYSRWRGVHSVHKRLRSLPNKKEITVLTSGWGKDLSRFFDYQTFNKEIENANIFALNILTRPKKVKGYSPTTQSINAQSLTTLEDIRNGVTYGLRFSNFSPTIFFWSFIFFLKTILPRWKTINKKDLFSCSIFRHSIVRQNTKYLIYFSYLTSFLSKQILDEIFQTIPNLKVYLGSDSADSATRFEILYAKKNGIFSISTPHGFQAYAMENYTYIADKIFVQGVGIKELLAKKTIPEEKIAVIGSSHEHRETRTLNTNKRVRITIATRSRGGRWSSYSSKQDVYSKDLETVIDFLLHDDRFSITIKSHPNGDFHEYYDHLVKKKNNANLVHIPTKWNLNDFFDLTDMLVCIGETPSFFISAFFGNIPIVFIKNTMTSILHSTNSQYRYASTVVENGEEAASAIEFISQNQANYESAIARQQEGRNKFDGGTVPEKLALAIIQSI